MKKFFIPALLFMGAMSSCSKNEVTEVLPEGDNSNKVGINISSGATKGVDLMTNDIETQGDIKLYAISEKTSEPTSYMFKFTDGDWISGVAPSWDEIGIPVVFYSAHEGTNPVELSVKVTNTSDLTTEANLGYEVSTASSVSHKDLVFHASKVNSIPLGGKINAYHTHGLSKINFLASTGTNKAYIARVQLMNVDKNGVATITPKNAISWSENSEIGMDYCYYADPTASSSQVAAMFDEGDYIATDKTKSAIMMIPQTLNDPDVFTTTTGLEAGTYVEVIYCLEDSEGNPIVGYTSADKHYEFDKFPDDIAANTPLYVKVAFGVKYDLVAGKQYDITLGLGRENSTGGIVLGKEFVDKDGDPIDTDPVDTGIPEPGEPAIPGASTQVDITVNVGDWGVTEDVEYID